MRAAFSTFTFLAVTGIQPVSAAPISANSDLTLFHDYTVNSGSVPGGISLSLLPGSLVLSPSLAESRVNDPTATTTDTPFVQVANPFTDPPIPYIATRLNRTVINAGTEGAEAEFNLIATNVDDPDGNAFDTSIVERTIEADGTASALITTAPVAADAMSNFVLGRGFVFENESNDLVSFNIVGEVRATLNASYNGLDGFARASATTFLQFEDLLGADVSFLPLSPYFRTIEEEDPGATITESLVIGEDLDGFSFSASASAIGDGSDTDASFDATFRYLYGVSIDAGGSLIMRTGYSQANAVDYTPGPVAPVPLPASALMMLSGLAAYLLLSRRRNRDASSPQRLL